MNMRYVFFLLLLGAASAQAADQIRFKATKQLDSRRNSGSQNVFGANTSLTQKEYVYRFDLQSVSPQLANPVQVEWVVMVEDMSGRIRPGGRGSAETNLVMSKMASIETDPIQINQRDWQGGNRAGKIEDKIEGYGVRITDKNGNQIFENYEPSSLKKQIDWKIVNTDTREEALKALRGLVGEGDQRPPRREPPPGRPRVP